LANFSIVEEGGLKARNTYQIEKIAFEEIKCSDWNSSPRFCFFQQWKEERKIGKMLPFIWEHA